MTGRRDLGVANADIVDMRLRNTHPSREQSSGGGIYGGVSWIDAAGTSTVVALDDACDLPLEEAHPARRIPRYKNSTHTPGRYWSATGSVLLEYESFLESKWMTMLDFDPAVVAFSSQPLRFVGHDRDGPFEHVPDLFARTADGHGHVIDVKAPFLAEEKKQIRLARRTARWCEVVGWNYWFVKEIDDVLWANVSFLAGYRRKPAALLTMSDRLLELVRQPTSIAEVMRFMEAPELARAVLLHLCWRQQIQLDLAEPLRYDSRLTHLRCSDLPVSWHHPTNPIARQSGISRSQGARMDRPMRLAVGANIEFEEETHQVLGLHGSFVRLMSESGGRQIIAVTELVADPSFRPAPEGQPMSRAVAGDMAAQVDQLPETEIKRIVELEGHLQEVLTGYRSGRAHEALPGEPRPAYTHGQTLTARLRAKAAETGMTERHLYRLLQAYQDAGRWGLVDGRKLRALSPLNSMDSRAIRAIEDQCAAETFESGARIGGRFMRRVRNRLDATHGAGVVPLPPARTFYRAVEHLLHLSPAGPTSRRQNDANKPDRAFEVLRASRPGEVVMIDTTRLDVIAYEPAADLTHAVELTYALDLATRSLLAWRLTPAGTKGIDVSLLLADMMAPLPMRMGWDDRLRFTMMRLPQQRLLDLDERLAEAAARPVIYPETLLVDLGKPYQSKVLWGAAQWLGISIQDARKARPIDKANIERSFETVRMQFSEHVAGCKSYDVAHRPSNPEAFARWTLEELDDFFAEYVIAVYQQRPTGGLHLPGFPGVHMSPNQAYEHAVAHAGYVVCPINGAMYYELLPIARCKIQDYGVDVNGLRYFGNVLHELRHVASPESGKYAGKWAVRYDPRDLRHAYFFDPRDNTWHLLDWIHGRPAHLPFTDVMLRNARKLVAVRGLDNSDSELIAKALLDLQNRTDAPETWLRIDRRAQLKDAQRARAAARDRANADPPIETHTEPAALYTTPVSEDDIDLSDLADLEPLGVWDPQAD
ncbi:TnsA-like heteromeric transposase endonuclease subunit [Nucisporomicrobium flavum]|uniref:TnsA-like heteromeric transposase endonuclease subunit n=1 Tax=Nucisporomicrobium flavum TaxID=2785915 RepID=UPI0018F7739B|nr:TnsA-like heteromeric transposase endonuclease subunit [Nucisporomicrobium flavum]